MWRRDRSPHNSRISVPQAVAVGCSDSCQPAGQPRGQSARSSHEPSVVNQISHAEGAGPGHHDDLPTAVCVADCMVTKSSSSAQRSRRMDGRCRRGVVQPLRSLCQMPGALRLSAVVHILAGPGPGPRVGLDGAYGVVPVVMSSFSSTRALQSSIVRYYHRSAVFVATRLCTERVPPGHPFRLPPASCAGVERVGSRAMVSCRSLGPAEQLVAR